MSLLKKIATYIILFALSTSYNGSFVYAEFSIIDPVEEFSNIVDGSSIDTLITEHNLYQQSTHTSIISQEFPTDAIEQKLWLDRQSALIRMGILERRIARSLGLPGDKSITINVLEGTTIQTREKKSIDIDILSVDATETEKKQGKFHFGLTGKHLIFSKPVEVHVKMDGKDGKQVDIKVKHAGDKDFNTSGLSTNPDTLCNTDGTASIPGSSTLVQGGFVTFYTCGASTFIVDDIGLDPVATYGLRKLKSTYSGSLIRVRRSSDNTEQDIGMTANNELNTGALMAFVGAGNGFVTTWYDQSGNGRNLFQTVAGNQPRIVNGGVLDTIDNGKPGIRWFDTNGSRLLQTAVAPFGSANEMTVVLVHKEIVRQVNVAWSLANDGQGIGRIFSHIPWTNGRIYFDVGGCCNSPQRLEGVYPFAIGTTNTLTYTNSVSNNTKSIYGNGSLLLSGPAAAGTIVQLRVGSQGVIPINGMISEFMIFNSAISTGQIQIIQQSQAAYYNLGGTYLPESPTNLTATSGDGQVGLSWTPPSYIGGASITDYTIEYKLSSGTGWTVFADGTSTSTGTTVTGLTNSLSYDFRVSATNSKGTGTPSTIATTLPQAVAGLQLWLRSDAGVIASAGKISSWIDQSGKGNTTTQSNSANQPSLVANALNFNPSISFSQGSATRLEGTFASRFTGTDITAFTVALPKSSSQSWAGMFTMWNSAGTNVDYNSAEGGVIMHRYNATTQIGAERQGVYYNTAANMLNRVSILSSRFGGGSMRIRANGASSYSGAVTSGNFNANSYAIGARKTGSYSNFLEGYVAETLVFNSVLSSTDQNKIESYLALKYGITLDQTTATNYTLSDGTIAWNSASGGIYKNDIAGVARDAGFSLNQTKSQSLNNTGDITVEALTTLGDKKSIVWANDGTATGTWIYTEKPSNITNRINREWQFQELNGDIGNIKISYPQTSLPSGFTGTLYMMIDTDNNFGNGGTTTLTGTLASGSWEFVANISHGNYITFGYKDTVPPTITSVSIASGALIPHGNFPLMVTYTDTESTIDTTSLTGVIYNWNATTGTWATIATLGYMSVSGATTSTGYINISGLPFGKYRFDISISDSAENKATKSYTYFVDGVEWTISSDTYNIGNISQNITTFGTGELIITIKTVGAGFRLVSNPISALSRPTGESLNYWNNTLGVGYDIWDNGGFSGTIVTYSPDTTLANITKNINQNGQKNTFTYRVKYGAQVDFMQAAGEYRGSVGFGLHLDYE